MKVYFVKVEDKEDEMFVEGEEILLEARVKTLKELYSEVKVTYLIM